MAWANLPAERKQAFQIKADSFNLARTVNQAPNTAANRGLLTMNSLLEQMRAPPAALAAPTVSQAHSALSLSGAHGGCDGTVMEGGQEKRGGGAKRGRPPCPILTANCATGTLVLAAPPPQARPLALATPEIGVRPPVGWGHDLSQPLKAFALPAAAPSAIVIPAAAPSAIVIPAAAPSTVALPAAAPSMVVPAPSSTALSAARKSGRGSKGKGGKN